MTKFSSHSPDEVHEAVEITDGYFLRIEEGDFKDVEFSFNQVIPREVDDDGNFHMDYDYTIWYSPTLDPELTVAEFEKVVADILHQILMEVANTIQVENIESPEDLLETPADGFEFKEHEILKEEV